MLTYRTEAREVSLAAWRRNRILKRKKVHGETPQSEARGGSPSSRGKRFIPRRPHPLNKSLETESSTIGSISGKPTLGI
ncbi:hypothetical protein SAMN05421677_101155 [Halobacillus aidingensis]|uniref:Uncharacterized protein n=1 Tax=Halobacillus aidingensis TaxID=240303 RepID=A0A1H0ECG1_HALAD|nr:hypothetical protein SAMN05421677_101155 [Halobacillus aidingensis]